jgi:hypothetical protein
VGGVGDEDEDAIEAALDAVLAAEIGEGGDRMADWGGDDEEDKEEEEVDWAGLRGMAGKTAVLQPKEKKQKVDKQAIPDTKPPPDNFSRLGSSHAPSPGNWTKFSQATMAECEVQAGQMLYLPAGWFHDVTSLAASSATPSASTSSPSVSSPEPPAFHMAFNYWFAPPDGDSFARPYTSKFWGEDWRQRNVE